MSCSGKLALTTLLKELDHRWLLSLLVKARSQFGDFEYQGGIKHCYAKYTQILKSICFWTTRLKKKTKLENSG